jgi:hypothetical protein
MNTLTIPELLQLCSPEELKSYQLLQYFEITRTQRMVFMLRSL